ncbi:type IV pilus biogenesis protein PilP [Solidesulfovibrio carbinoliphilus]|nr:type IV pilus biogenesis protein PilP [Solidesulfovibrio carbinoliphilus]
MTELRATLDEVKLRVAIEQEREKLAPKLPVAVPQAKTPQTPIMLPPEPPKAPATPKKETPVVVSMQGMDGRTSATIRGSSGRLQTVRPGDPFEGGVVNTITREGVLVRRGNTSTTLTFE